MRSDDFVEVGLALRRNGETPEVPVAVHFSDQRGAFLVIDGTPHPITIDVVRRRSGETPVTLNSIYVPRVDAGDLSFLNVAQDLAEVADDLGSAIKSPLRPRFWGCTCLPCST